MSVKGYKIFNSDWTCRGFQYKVGETYVHNGDPVICKSGFHFCENAADCFNYYIFDSNNKVAEIEALGDIITREDKSVTNKIRIIREISWTELLTIINVGKNCTGRCNTGDWNTGDWNTGDCNTGNRNTGNWNTGDCNTGNRNTGNWNSTNYSTGFFNTRPEPIYLFNKPTNLSREQIYDIEGFRILYYHYENSWWIPSFEMCDEEKRAHPEYEATGGYLKTVDFKTACKIMWDKLSEQERNTVKEIPNFDPAIFKEITGIDVNKERSDQDRGAP